MGSFATKCLVIISQLQNINMQTITLSRNFRFTLPKDICDKLDVVPGQDIDFVCVRKFPRLAPVQTEKQKVAPRKKLAISRLKPAA